MHKNSARIKNKKKFFSKYWRLLLFYHHIISLNKVFVLRPDYINNWKKNFENFGKKNFSNILTLTPETNFKMPNESLQQFLELKITQCQISLIFFISTAATFLYPRLKKYWSVWTQDTNFYLLVSCKLKLQKLRLL